MQRIFLAAVFADVMLIGGVITSYANELQQYVLALDVPDRVWSGIVALVFAFVLMVLTASAARSSQGLRTNY